MSPSAPDPATGPRPKPLMTIKPSRSWLPVDPRELWVFRELLVRLTARDVTLRYRQTALGVAWVVLQPLLAAGILSFVFGSVAGLPAPAGIPYFVFSLAGMVAWNTFSQTTIRASGSLLANSQLVSKVYFPRLLLPLSSVGSTLVDTVVSFVLLAVLMAVNGVHPGWAVVLLPVWLLLLLAVALGVGLAAGALMVRYRDVQFVLPVAVQFLLFASPIAYTLASVPENARWLYDLNPLTGLLEGFRWSVLGMPRPSTALMAYAAAVSIATLVVGIGIFNRTERQFADVI